MDKITQDKNKTVQELKKIRDSVNYIILNLEEDNIENKKEVFNRISFIEIRIGDLSDDVVEYFLTKS